MNRDRIVQPGLNALGAQHALKLIAIAASDGIDVVNVAPAVFLDRRRQMRRSPEQRRVAACMSAARFGPGFKVPELDAQDRALNGVHAVVEALQQMVIALLLAPIAQHAHCFGLIVAVGHDDTPLAAGAEIFTGIEAEAAGCAEAAGARAFVLRAVRLACVLDNRYSVVVGNRPDRVHVSHLPVEMDGNDGLGAGCNLSLELSRIHRQRHRLDIDENRPCACIADRRYGRDEGKRHGNDFIAGADAGREKRQMQGAGPGVDCDRMFDVAIVREFLLEAGDLLAQYVLPRSQDAEHCGVDFALDGIILCLEVQERDHAMRLASSSSMMRPR
ncbi:hypothetical protein RHECNPAF_2190075 [Rhizobium etli CNPAF512]|nr:hypothetical protein RHECNPAF_2190075 [Rhizobium etli CNPAF512]